MRAHENMASRDARSAAPIRSVRPLSRRIAVAAAVALGVTALALMLAFGAAPAGATATAPDAMTVAKETVNQVMAVLKDQSMPLAQKREKLREIVAGHFDFRAMARSSLGYHWRNLPEDKRAEFTQVFSSFIQDAYLSRFQGYSGQKVNFLREVPQGPGYDEIDTTIVQPGKDPIPVKYMLEQKNGEWKVYDVTVDNISIVANYRNQFNRVINNQGFDTLVSDLKRKQKELAASLGNQ